MADSDLIRGNVDTVILKVLYEGDRYGYDLIKQINARSDGQWEIKQPTVYACLKRLEKQGFVSSYWDSSASDGGRRKYYSLTDSGKEVFIKYKNEFERANALFGGIISGGDNVYLQPVDDYSDVEEEGYSVPKRRSRPKREKPAVKADEPSPAAAEQFTAPILEEVQEEVQVAENAPQQQQEQEEAQAAFDYIQQDLFSYAEQVNALTEQVNTLNDVVLNEILENEATPASEPDSSTEQNAIEQAASENASRTALDPRAIIDRYYASEKGESYFDARGKAAYEERTSFTPPPTAPEQPKRAPQPIISQNAPAPVRSAEPAPRIATPAPAPAPRPVQATVTPFGFAENDESAARKEYKTVLSDLVDRFEVAPPSIRTQADDTQKQEQAAAVTSAAPEKKFFKVTQAVRDLGNDITIKDHNDSAKQYTHKYYYYSNRLLMTHYTVMCAAMFVIGLLLFLTFYMGAGLRMNYDYLLYIAAGLLPIIMFIVSIICFAGNPDKKKRINVSFRASIIIRIVIMIQVAVVIYCLNLIWGMPIGFSAAYIPSLVIPCAYAVFIPISELIFMALLKSEHYAVE